MLAAKFRMLVGSFAANYNASAPPAPLRRTIRGWFSDFKNRPKRLTDSRSKAQEFKQTSLYIMAQCTLSKKRIQGEVCESTNGIWRHFATSPTKLGKHLKNQSIWGDPRAHPNPINRDRPSNVECPSLRVARHSCTARFPPLREKSEAEAEEFLKI